MNVQVESLWHSIRGAPDVAALFMNDSQLEVTISGAIVKSFLGTMGSFLDILWPRLIMSLTVEC